MQNINIQFLRAFAALFVVFYHTSAHYFAVGGDNDGNIFSFMVQIGYVGVDIFFVISGYIMWISTKKLSGWSGVKYFVFSRLIRIYPIYWIFLVFMVIFYHHSLYNFDFLGSIFLTFSTSSKLLLEVAWTLQYELYFYLFFALLLFVQKKFFIPIFILLFVILIGIEIYATMVLDIYNHNKFNAMSTFWTFWTAPYMLEFILGVFIGYFFENYRLKSILILFILVLILLSSALYYQKYIIDSSLSEGYYLPQRVFFFGLSAMLLVSIAVELHLRKVQFSSKFFTTLGDSSYSLYLTHNIILLYLYQIGLRDWIATHSSYPAIWMIFIIGFIVAISVLFYRWVEVPMMRYSRKIKKTLSE